MHTPPATGLDEVTKGCAVVEVKERGLGTLEQDLFAALERLVHERHGVGDVRLDARTAHVEVLVRDLLGVEGQLVEDLRQDGVLLLGQHLELGAEDLGIEEVLHPQPDS